MNEFNENEQINSNNNLSQLKYYKNNKKKKLFDLLTFIIIFLTFEFMLYFILKKAILQRIKKENNVKANDIELEKEKIRAIIEKHKVRFRDLQNILKNEAEMPHLKEVNKKRIFEKRIPLPKEIKCKPHFINEELTAFLSFLTKDTIYFETGSGCSSIIAKYYAKKTYAVEGCIKYYKIDIKNGLKDVIIFKDLKPDDYTWSFPGKKSNLNDWKNYFQSYKKEYNADVILIDGRFKIATAMDIFDKIRDDTVILLHEYFERPSYFILEEYYDYVYHWGRLHCFVKKKNIKQIPLEIQKKYWKDSL
jgi:hypothetical protein